MIRLNAVVVVAALLCSCRYSLESADPGAGGPKVCKVSTTSPSCRDAVDHKDLAWIETNIFAAHCNFGGCHKSASDDGQLDLNPSVSHRNLVNVASKIDTTRMLVVPNDVNSSYLMLMLGAFPPEMATPPGVLPDVGTMPLSTDGLLCCQKLEAIERWIADGAPNQ